MLPPRLASRSRWRLGACALSLLASCAGEATSALDAAPPDATLDGAAPDADGAADGSIDTLPVDPPAAPDAAAPDVSAPDVSAPDVSAPDVSAPDVTSPDDASPDARPDIVSADDAVSDAAPLDAAPLDAAIDVSPADLSSPDVPVDAAPEVRTDVASDVAPDASVDARSDVAPDVRLDAAIDAPPDAPPDVPLDARPDAAPDVAFDARPDAAADAAPDIAPDAGVAGCGLTTRAVFSLPPGYASGAFNALGDTSLTCAGGGLGDPSYALVDLDGDRRLDMVMTDSCTDAQVGTSRWLVHRNTGAGLTTNSTFALPAGYAPGAFNALVDTSLACGGGGAGDPSYALVDLDGDRRPDLVMTDSCTDAQVGTSRWAVHRNTGSGFEATATPFALPPGYAPGAFNAFSDTSLACAGGALGDPSYALVDLDGDGRLDFVMTDSCADARVGTSRWVMHRNTGSGFAATPTIFGLPAGYASGAFTAFSDTSLTCAGGGAGDPSYALVDLDGDRRLDLVTTDSCTDAQVGTSRWVMHRNSGGGFDTTATLFTLPPGYAPGAFTAFSDASLTCAGGGAGDPSYALVDLDGDGRLDLVMTDSCTDAQVGTSRWAMHRNTGGGFAAAITAFTLPSGYTPGAFTAFSDTSLTCGGGGEGDPSYALLDLAGDPRLDLVMTDSCTDAQVGTSRWIVYTSTCAP